MKVLPNFAIYFSIFMFAYTNFIYETNAIGIEDPITFSQQEVAWLDLYDGDETEYEGIAYSRPEERQKLCYYAKMVAGLPYIDYSYVPDWQIYIPSSIIPDWHYAMHCGTLPKMYVLLHCEESTMQITMFNFWNDKYKFDPKIIEAHSVIAVSSTKMDTDQRGLERNIDHNENLGNIEENKDEDMMDYKTRSSKEDDGGSWSDFIPRHKEFDEYEVQNRKQICVTAQKSLSIPLHFLHFNVPEPQIYEFEYEAGAGKDSRMAIPCPTSPKLFLVMNENSKNEFQSVIVSGSLKNYEFEAEEIKPISVSRVPENEEQSAMGFIEHKLHQLNSEDRKALCALARKNDIFSHVPYVEDEEVAEARLYSFKYSKETEKRDVAISCSAIPSIYLRLYDSEERHKITITLPQSLADLCVYGYEMVESFEILNTELEENSERIEPRKKLQMEKHPFVTMSEENRWNLCWGAQKYILNDDKNRKYFRFASEEPILSDFILLLIPKHMQHPKFYVLHHINQKQEEDLLIQCSVWPKMYIRQSNNQINILLQQMRYLI